MILLPKEGIISITVLPETLLEDDFIHQRTEELRVQLAKLTVGKKTEQVLEMAYFYINRSFQQYKEGANAAQLERHKTKVRLEDCLK